MEFTQYARLYGIQAVLVALFTIVLVGVAVVVVWSRTQAGQSRRKAVKRTLVVAVMLLGAAFTALVALTPSMGDVGSDGVEWNPLSAHEYGSAIANSQILGNLVMLTWIGLCVPALWRRLRWVHVVGIVAAASLSIEVMQLAFIYGRAAATQDLILNVVGGAVAAAIGVTYVRPWVAESPDQ